MNEQTNPDTGVSQGDGTIESAVARLVKSEDQSPAAEQTQSQPDVPQDAPAEQPQGQAEVTVDDLPDEAPQPESVDAFEIVHGGQQHKLTRADVIKYAQQGFDYTQKTQVLADQQRSVVQRLQALAEVEQVQPHLMQSLATVKSLESQLAPYQNVDWVRIANEDPIAYSQQRARYDVLQATYQRAVGEYQHVSNSVQQHTQQIKAHMLAQEDARLPDLIPEWKDEAKRSAGKAELVKYLQANGVDPAAASEALSTAFAVSTLEKARRYDQLVKSKADKSKQLRTLPPVTVPGAKTGSARADQEAQLKNKLRKTGSIDDAAALLLNRSK